jgi:RNA polymerase sigma-70 factor (ECF subfamily)
MDSRDIVQRAQQGDERAFTTLYAELYAPLFRFVFLRTKDRDLAEDITQNTFIKFLAALPTFVGSAPLPYLHTVARNAIIDHYRKKQPDYDDEALWALASTAPTAEEALALGEEVAAVVSVLSQLSPAEEVVVRLKYLDGLETAEIATYLNKTEEAVRQLLSRGVRHIRSILDGPHE